MAAATAAITGAVGVSATITPAVGDPFVVNAVPDVQPVQLEAPTRTIATETILDVSSEDAASIRVGDSVEWLGSDSYAVVEKWPWDLGVIRLRLRVALGL